MKEFGKGTPVTDEDLTDSNTELKMQTSQIEDAYQTAIQAWQEGVRGMAVLQNYIATALNKKYDSLDQRLISHDWICTYLSVYSYLNKVALPKHFKKVDTDAYTLLLLGQHLAVS